jgi:hypothetical protein
MAAGSKGLATSGVNWGLSCTVADEASMGVILGHMKLFGAVDIGFAPLGPVRKQGKSRKAVESGRKGGLARAKAARRGTAERKPLLVAAEEAINGIAGPEFKTAIFTDALAKLGWKGNSQHHKAVTHLLEKKRIKRKGRGLYTKLPALVKTATG